jgi:hypothetical protein
VADGTVIAEGHGPATLKQSMAHIADGRAGGDEGLHEVIVFTFFGTDDASDNALEHLRWLVAGQAEWLGVPETEVFVAGGGAQSAADAVRSLWDAGADTVVLRPVRDDPLGQLAPVLTALGR